MFDTLTRNLFDCRPVYRQGNFCWGEKNVYNKPSILGNVMPCCMFADTQTHICMCVCDVIIYGFRSSVVKRNDTISDNICYYMLYI